jgi:small subunit ribosomal protein S6
MNDYEVLLLLDPELAEERGGEIVARVRERVEGDKGTWDGHEPWGRRKLAYEIDHKAEGVYHLLLFTAAPDTLEEITRVLKITDGVVRHLAVRRVKGGVTTAPALGAAAPAPVEAAPAPAAPAPATPAPAGTAPAGTAPAPVATEEPASAAAETAAPPAAEEPAPAPVSAAEAVSAEAVSRPADDADGSAE